MESAIEVAAGKRWPFRVPFEDWAKAQPAPYYLKLNKWRLNEGSRWYDCTRTQHAYEGFIGALKLSGY